MITQNGFTKDTHVPCFECRLNGSLASGCFDGKEIIIWMINSIRKGDMKRMLNEITDYYTCNALLFTSIFNDNLSFTLKGFKEVTVYHKAMKEYIPCLRGKWKCR